METRLQKLEELIERLIQRNELLLESNAKLKKRINDIEGDRLAAEESEKEAPLDRHQLRKEILAQAAELDKCIAAAQKTSKQR